MPAAVLLNNKDPLYVFEHMMQHRAMLSVMGPLQHFSRVPYLLDPSYGVGIRAGPWDLDHQQAHNDFGSVFPTAAHSQNVADANLQDPESETWWTFVNHQQHYEANRVISTRRKTSPAW